MIENGRVEYGIYVCATSSGKMGNFRKTSTDIMQPKPYTRRFKTGVYVADTKGRRKAN